MGNICESNSVDNTFTKNEKSADTNYTKYLAAESEQNAKIYKLLLLGTGESGKSTIFKQMQILHEEGFSDAEEQTFRHVLRANLVDSMQVLLTGIENLGFDLELKESEECARGFKNLDTLGGEFWVPEITAWTKQLWEIEPVLKRVFYSDERAKLQILDSAQYFFENVQRFQSTTFKPSKDDILRARLRTSGIVERNFVLKNDKNDKHEGHTFRFLDVGGQRNERRKWIHCFSDVTALLFITAISEFDQTLYEDEDKNRLLESMEEFDKVCNQYQHFKNSAIILFLNKVDLFEEKIKRSTKGLAIMFPDYNDFKAEEEKVEKDEVQKAKFFIKSKYLDYVVRFECSKNCLREGKRVTFKKGQSCPLCNGLPANKEAQQESEIQLTNRLFCHLTQATDTEHIKTVFSDVKQVVIAQSLSKMGMM